MTTPLHRFRLPSPSRRRRRQGPVEGSPMTATNWIPARQQTRSWPDSGYVLTSSFSTHRRFRIAELASSDFFLVNKAVMKLEIKFQ